MESLKQSVEEMNNLFNNKMMQFQQELNTCHTSNTTLVLASEFCEFKSFVLNALKSLQTQIEILMDMQDQNEMRRRNKILLLHGVSEDKKDVLKVVSSTLSTQLQAADIDVSSVKYCHRLGRINESKPRPILIKFHDRVARNKIWAAKTNLKNTGNTLSEFLIKKRHNLFLIARQRYGISKCWTHNGSVIVLGPDGSKVRVNSMADLDALPGPSSSDMPAIMTERSIPTTRSATGAKIKKSTKK